MGFPWIKHVSARLAGQQCRVSRATETTAHAWVVVVCHSPCVDERKPWRERSIMASYAVVANLDVRKNLPKRTTFSMASSASLKHLNRAAASGSCYWLLLYLPPSAAC